MHGITIRPIRSDEWERVRDLRVRAVHDPAAAMAFVDTAEQTASRTDAAWRDRATGASEDVGETATARQFIAEDASGAWVGSVTGLLEHAGDDDYEGREVPLDGCAVVGVYVAPEARGGTVLGELLDALQGWAAGPLRLSVHTGNARAVRAYEKVGFTPVGAVYAGALGPTVEMRRH